MGCQCSRFAHDKTKSAAFLETEVGLLDVHITNGQFYDKKLYASLGKDVNIFLKIQVSNQDYVSRMCSNFNSDGFFNSYFSFFINSNYRANGRILEIQLHKKLEGTDSEALGKSKVDISRMIGVQQSKQEIKCILNNKKEPLGFVNCLLTFNPMDYKTVSFRFLSIILRKECNFSHQLRVETLLGEECLSTSTCQDSNNQAASWLKDILTFKVPNLLKFGKITLYDNNKSVGETVIKIQQLITVEEYQELICFSQLFDSNNNEIGNIKYSIIVGRNPKFAKEISNVVESINSPLKGSREHQAKSEEKIKSLKSLKNSGVEISLKNRYSFSTLVDEPQSEIANNNKGTNVYINGSLRCFSVFSIEDLSKLDKPEDK